MLRMVPEDQIQAEVQRPSQLQEAVQEPADQPSQAVSGQEEGPEERQELLHLGALTVQPDWQGPEAVAVPSAGKSDRSALPSTA